MDVNRWYMLAVLFVVRAAMGFQFQTVGSLGPVIVDALAIDYATFGMLVGLYLLPGAVIALPGGMLGDRFGPRQTAIAGLALMVVGGVATGVSDSVALFVAGRLISGAGAIVMNVVVTRMVVDWFAGRELRTAMGVLVASWPFGIAIGLLAYAPLANYFHWQFVMFAVATACALTLVLFATLYRDPQIAAAPLGNLRTDLTRREWQLTLIAGFIWGAYNVAYIVLVTFLPAVFIAQNYNLSQATSVVSLVGWALIAVIPVGGYVADRSGRPNAVMSFGLLATALGTALVAFPPLTPAAYAVILLTAGLPAGAIMALPAAALRAEARGFGTGVYYAWSYALMALLPIAGGLMRDLSGSRALPILSAAVTLVAAAVGVAAFDMIARSCSARGRPRGAADR